MQSPPDIVCMYVLYVCGGNIWDLLCWQISCIQYSTINYSYAMYYIPKDLFIL